VANPAHGFFRGVGEVMFQDNLATGVIFLVAILVNSRISAAFAAVRSAVALLTTLAIGGDGFSVYHGLYGFNAVLCAIALGGLFFVLTWKSALYALLAAVFSVPAFAAIAVLLSPIGMPALTAPFVLTTWLVPVAQGGLRGAAPVALADVTTAENIRASSRVRAAGPSATSEPGEAT
jgi:urea transporter